MMKKNIVLTVILLIMLSVSAGIANAADRLLLQTVIGEKGEEKGALSNVADIYFDRSGNMYAADSVNHKILIFDANGEYWWEFGKFGSDPGELNAPSRIAVDHVGNMFVVDYRNLSLVSDPGSDLRNYYRIQKFSPKGTLLWSVGAPGKGIGEFNGAIYDIEIDREGNLYALDRYNFRVQVFNSNGKFLRAFGKYGNKDGEFDYPFGLLVDNDFNIYVSDTNNHRIQKFDKEGNFILAFGREGYNDSEFSTSYPTRMYFDRENNLCALTSFSFYTSGKRRYIKCLVQKFDLNGNFIKKLYAIERFYDDDTSYYMTFLNSDIDDSIYLFHSRDKTLNKYRFKGAGINWASITKHYYLELRKPTEEYHYKYLSSTSTRENDRNLSGWNPIQTINFNYDHDDQTNIYLSNELSYTQLTGPRDDKSLYTTTTTWGSWEGTRDVFSSNSYLRIRQLFDKTESKYFTYILGYNQSNYQYDWTTKAPEIKELSTTSRFYTNANFDITYFSDLEIGYNKYYNLYKTDSEYDNYGSSNSSPNEYVYIKYHTDF